MAPLKIRWDERETAVLMDYFIQYRTGKITQADAISKTSNELRERAKKNGLKIDDTFRNENGIRMQMSKIEDLYIGRKIHLNNGKASQIFKNIVNKYLNDRVAFDKILKEARDISIDNSSIQEQFFKWLSDKVFPAQISEFHFIYSEIETFCINYKILNQSLFETTDMMEIAYVKSIVDSNRIFRFRYKNKIKEMQTAMKYYYNFIKEYNSTTLTSLSVHESNSLKVENSVQTLKDASAKYDKKLTVSFEALGSYAFTCPESLSYFGENYLVKNWTQLYVQAVCCLYKDYPEIIKSLKYTNELKGFYIVDDFMVSQMIKPEELKDGLFLETNLSATDIVSKIKQLLILCQVDYRNVIITYYSTKSETPPTSKADLFALLDSKEDVPQLKSKETLIPYDLILQKNFPNGYRLNSTIDLKRFIKYCNELYGTKLDASDETVKNKIKHNILEIGIMYEDYVFSAESLVFTDTKKRLINYIEQNFLQGKKVIYYKALFEEFNEEFLKQHIYNEDMLRIYLLHECGEKYVFENSFMSQEKNIQTDFKNEIKEILISYGAPLKIEELYKKLPHLSTKYIDSAIHTNKEFVCNARGEYFYISLIDLNADELDNIADIIQQIIDTNYFISNNELINAIDRKYPSMLERFPQFSQLGLRNAISYYLSNRFSFNRNIISSLKKQLSMSDVFAEFAKTHSSFTIDELNVLKNEIDATINFDSIYENSLRISQHQFVSKSQANFDVLTTDKAISAFCTGDYIPLASVISFGTFPYTGFPWNIYLLEHYVSKYSAEYKLLHTGFNADNCVGAIVKKCSDINSFNDLIIDVLAHSDIDLNKEYALQYLYDMGYLARRRFSNIDQILIKARAKKG